MRAKGVCSQSSFPSVFGTVNFVNPAYTTTLYNICTSRMPSEDQLTVLEDKAILIISSLGLALISAVVFWVARQSAGVPNALQQAEGEAGLLGGRTRVVPGGREALKAARKEAKKRAKAEFKESSAGLKRRSRVHEVMRCVWGWVLQYIHRGTYATTELRATCVRFATDYCCMYADKRSHATLLC